MGGVEGRTRFYKLTLSFANTDDHPFEMVAIAQLVLAGLIKKERKKETGLASRASSWCRQPVVARSDAGGATNLRERHNSLFNVDANCRITWQAFIEFCLLFCSPLLTWISSITNQHPLLPLSEFLFRRAISFFLASLNSLFSYLILYGLLWFFLFHLFILHCSFTVTFFRCFSFVSFVLPSSIFISFRFSLDFLYFFFWNLSLRF